MKGSNANSARTVPERSGADRVSAESVGRRPLELHCVMMLRNEADIISGTINHALELFDSIALIDICSTDGTRAYVEAMAQRDNRLKLYSCRTQERYQSAMMDRLARHSYEGGADWVFFLDADEFVNVEGRAGLQAYMHAFAGDVMHMPWINLIPSQYGDFGNFSLDQEFSWSGRVSPFRKVAVSQLFASTYPEFHIHEGNHNVSPAHGRSGANENLGLGLLHIPVRSAARLKYKLSNGIRLLESKHNAVAGEGNHAHKILNLIGNSGSQKGYLNLIASNYGSNEDEPIELDPQSLNYPVKHLPKFMTKSSPIELDPVEFSETVSRDSRVNWKKAEFVKGSPVSAQIDRDEIVISAQPIRGSGERMSGLFDRFDGPNPNVPKDIDTKLLIELASASFVKIDVLRFSAWSKLIPLLYTIFALSRPRRYVELGVHNGMSFFAGCQISEQLKTQTDCVAVDSWVGDPHASFHSSDIFETFRETIKRLYPDQTYIQGMFLDARSCFEDGSIDLLHIDGYHTYEAVREDFETWLPKMSGNGIIIFHDINVHERGFGVWRYWEELKINYPGFGFMHSHGLGVLYVGDQNNAVSKMFDLLLNNRDVQIFAQQYFETLGELAIEHREQHESASQFVHAMAEKDAKIVEFQGYLAHRDAIIADLQVADPAGRDRSSSVDSQAQVLQAQRDQIISKLNDSVRESSAGVTLSPSDPALQAARSAMEIGKQGGLFGKLRMRNARKRRNRNIQAIVAAIADSGMFDLDHYMATYPDVRDARIDPIRHFVEHGAFELRDPSRSFSSRGYFHHNRDVLQAGINPLYHYISHGRDEGRHW